MQKHSVVISGCGPTGMMLAGELALAGVDVAIVERRVDQQLAGSRAGGLHARTIEVLDQRGIAGRFLREGQVMPALHFHVPLDIADLPTRHPYVLALWQNHIERILAGWIDELGVPVLRGCEVAGLHQDETGVDVMLGDGTMMRADYLVGCDGGRSIVRKAAGIDFPGSDATVSWLIAEAEMAGTPTLGFHVDDAGRHAIGPVEPDKPCGVMRVVLTERQVERGATPTLADVSDAMTAIYGSDFGIHNPRWISRFTDMTRQAASYRHRRVLLAGDAAHVHPPLGGQGLNIGVQDAVNLGWKLAAVVKGTVPAALLDSYHAERHPVAAEVLRITMALVALSRPDQRTQALGDVLSGLIGMAEPRRHLGAAMSGLAVRYDLGEGHALLGRRMPDLDLETDAGVVRVFALLRDGEGVLINFAAPGRIDLTPWSDRVRLVDATFAGRWLLPVLGEVPAPAAVLVRPDGHVAWVDDGRGAGLGDALTAWFGPPFND